MGSIIFPFQFLMKSDFYFDNWILDHQGVLLGLNIIGHLTTTTGVALYLVPLELNTHTVVASWLVQTWINFLQLWSIPAH